MKESASAAIIFHGEPALFRTAMNTAPFSDFPIAERNLRPGSNGVAVPEPLVWVLPIQEQAEAKDRLLAVTATAVYENLRLGRGIKGRIATRSLPLTKRRFVAQDNCHE
jgi:hypothetical protein